MQELGWRDDHRWRGLTHKVAARRSTACDSFEERDCFFDGLRYLGEAIELCPEDWWSHVELAKTLEIAGRPHEAREALQYAMQSSEFEEKYKPHLEAEIERLKGATPHT